MPKHLIRRYLPTPEQIEQIPFMRRFAPHLTDPRVWHLNRHTVAGAVYWGLFCAFLPIPLQMIPAALGAIYFRVNLPLSIALVWLSNPFTMVPILYIAYLIGALILQEPMLDMQQIVHLFNQLVNWALGRAPIVVQTQHGGVLAPMLLGLLIEACVVSFIGGFFTKIFWRWHVVQAWKKRHGGKKPTPPSAH